MAIAPATPASQATRLGCGRDVDDVWDTIDRPPNTHERACVYCTQARTELAALAEAARDLSAADRQDPNLRVPDQMLANVLAIVRTEVRRGRTIPLQRRVPPAAPTADPGHNPGPDPVSGGKPGPDAGLSDVPGLTVSELVIATVVRETCDRNPNVEVRRVSIDSTPAQPTRTGTPHNVTAGDETGPRAGEVEPVDVSMDLQATVSHTAAIPALLTGLRTAIQAAVAAQIGVTVSRINVDVQDLLDA